MTQIRCPVIWQYWLLTNLGYTKVVEAMVGRTIYIAKTCTSAEFVKIKQQEDKEFYCKIPLQGGSLFD